MCRSRIVAGLFGLTLAASCWSQDQAVTTLALPDGEELIAWISTSSFRFCRSWGEEKCAARPPAGSSGIEVTRADGASSIRLNTEYVTVEIDRKDGRLRVSDSRGKELMAETGPAKGGGGAVAIERAVTAGEAFYGLGARRDERADARGQIVRTSRPFLISSQGYGLDHRSAGDYVFDLASTSAERYQIRLEGSQKFEYYFYYGPDPKSILEEHRLAVLSRGVRDFGVLKPDSLPRFATLLPAPQEGSWESLADSIRMLVHASLSGTVNPVFDLAAYRGAPDALFRRAVQLASVMPLVCDSDAAPLTEERRKVQDDMLRWRRRLVSFLQTYVEETNSRGYPMIHPLPMQYPNDVKGREIADQFLLGDEILVAPIHTETGRRPVYFPMGNWTDIRTNRLYPGRQTVEIESPASELPLFVRNGSIIPLASDEPGGPMALHYLPKLAAEFFLYEPDTYDYSQMHASPALDLMRLEIESRKARTYEWVVHHLPAVRQVRTGETLFSKAPDRRSLQPGTWYYDREQENLHVMVEVPAGATRITHIEF
ncbi:MAG: hypothetical protein ACE141_06425 [Bryobacteraceae bacterium]